MPVSHADIYLHTPGYAHKLIHKYRDTEQDLYFHGNRFLFGDFKLYAHKDCHKHAVTSADAYLYLNSRPHRNAHINDNRNFHTASAGFDGYVYSYNNTDEHKHAGKYRHEHPGQYEDIYACQYCYGHTFQYNGKHACEYVYRHAADNACISRCRVRDRDKYSINDPGFHGYNSGFTGVDQGDINTDI